jgi:hypothetical protein
VARPNKTKKAEEGVKEEYKDKHVLKRGNLHASTVDELATFHVQHAVSSRHIPAVK